MQGTGLTGAELTAILGAAAPEPEHGAAAVALLDDLHQQSKAVVLAPEVFESGRFGPRSARVVHDVLLEGDGPVSARDSRVVRLDGTDPADAYSAVSAAYARLLRLPVIEERDFVGLGLAEHVKQKIFANLIFRGYLDGDGLVIEQALPAPGEEPALVGDFDPLRERLFWLLTGLCRDHEEAANPTLLPSDLKPQSGLSPAERAELHDNLVFNRYLDPDGTVLWTEFFAEALNLTDFCVSRRSVRRRRRNRGSAEQTLVPANGWLPARRRGHQGRQTVRNSTSTVLLNACAGDIGDDGHPQVHTSIASRSRHRRFCGPSSRASTMVHRGGFRC
jgi:hypothetical protein